MEIVVHTCCQSLHPI